MLLESMSAAVALAGAKFLAKKSIAAVAGSTGLLDGEVAGEMAGGVVDWFKGKATDEAKRKKLTQPFEQLEKTIASRLKPLFEEEDKRRKQDARLGVFKGEEIVAQLCLTLEDRTALEFFLAENLDAARVTERLREVRPLEKDRLSVADMQFYHRALEQLVPVLIGLSAKLPEFDKGVARELLNRSEQVEGKVDKVNQKLDAQDAKEKAEREDFEQRYRAVVQSKHNHLELFGADIAREAQKLPLSVAYVSLDLQSEENGGSTKSAEALFDSLLPEARGLLIRGEAGTGKSTLFRWAAIEAALEHRSDRLRQKYDRMAMEQAMEDDDDIAGEPIISITPWLNAPANAQARAGLEAGLIRYNSYWWHRVPFLIRLRDCPGGRIPGPDQFVSLLAKELGEPPKNWVVDLLDDGRGLILLDGVDEVREDFRESGLREDLATLMNAYPKTYFVVSTRPGAVPPDWLGGLGFREARINPMGRETVRNWSTAGMRRLPWKRDPKRRRRSGSRCSPRR